MIPFAVISAALIGLFTGLSGRYLASLVASVILAIVIEAFGAEFVPFYDFGDHLFKLLLICFGCSSVVHLIARLLKGGLHIALKNPAQESSSAELPSLEKKSEPHPADAGAHPLANRDMRVVMAHGLGFLNAFWILGTLALAVTWFINRTASPALREQIQQALVFQAAYSVLYIPLAVWQYSQMAAVASALFMTAMNLGCLVMTIMGTFMAYRKGSYQYPGVNLILSKLGMSAIARA
jgi:hypothetical protein